MRKILFAMLSLINFVYCSPKLMYNDGWHNQVQKACPGPFAQPTLRGGTPRLKDIMRIPYYSAKLFSFRREAQWILPLLVKEQMRKIFNPPVHLDEKILYCI